ncbi:MAG: NAD(P)/FAD-dependent oxidoreductase [Bacteroidota bacterium]
MKDIIIIGGGLAGLSAAIHLSRAGKQVGLLEKKGYPRHKVCGEYVSNEVLPYFEKLGVDIESVGPNHVQRFRLCAPSGKFAEARLPLGGFGLSRYRFDEFLYQNALAAGVDVRTQTTVTEVHFQGDHFQLRALGGLELEAKVVLGSFGKRSVVDKNLSRPFFSQPSRWMGVKHMLDYDYPADLVALYNFDGGYCGAVRIEDGSLSMAYLTTHDAIKPYGSLAAFEANVLHANPRLKTLLSAPSKLARPQTISNVSFRPKRQVVDHILMLGDAAGMIAPVCGNGMAMGIHAAKIASDLVLEFLNGNIDRSNMEQTYQKQWRHLFGQRLFWGRQIQQVMGRPAVSTLAVGALRGLPGILPGIIRQTHGKAFA